MGSVRTERWGEGRECREGFTAKYEYLKEDQRSDASVRVAEHNTKVMLNNTATRAQVTNTGLTGTQAQYTTTDQNRTPLEGDEK